MKLVFAFASLVLSAAATAAFGDTAIVVGVAGYPNLAARWRLEGTVKDMRSMAVALKSYGFENIVVLEDKQATREAILAALDQAAASAKPTERFVFYFAGHGCRDPQPLILPYNAKPKAAEVSITRELLSEKVRAIPAATRTVILDSCYSGGMAKALGIVSRCYQPFVSKGPEPVDEPEPVAAPEGSTAQKPVCYVTAASNRQPAIEYNFPDQGKRGLFTFFLTKHLDGQQKPWGDVVQGVQSDIETTLEKDPGFSQNPQVSENFLKKPVFNGVVVPDKPLTVPANLLDLYSAQRQNTDELVLKVDPNEVKVSIGQHVTLLANAKKAGYLVVLGQDRGHYYRIYPTEASVKEAEIGPGETRSIVVAGDAVGMRIGKAFLYKDQSTARAVIENTPTMNSLSAQQLKKALVPIRKDDPGFATAMVSLEMLPTLLGGLELVDASAVWKRLSAPEDPLGTHLLQRVAYQLGKDKVEDLVTEIAKPENRTEAKLAMWLNLCLQDKDFGTATLFPGLQPAEDEAPTKLIERNRTLLLKAFTGAIREAKP